MRTKIESPNPPIPLEIQELVLLETLKALLTAAIRALSHAEPANLPEVSRDINATAEEVMAASLHQGDLTLTPEEQQRRQKLFRELRQQRSFCRALLRRWRRSILLRRQLLEVATEPVTYGEPLEPRW